MQGCAPKFTFAGSLFAQPMLVLDSLPYGGDNDCTQLPVNPDDYIFTPYAQSLLAREGCKALPAATSLEADVPAAPVAEVCGGKHACKI